MTPVLRSFSSDSVSVDWPRNELLAPSIAQPSRRVRALLFRQSTEVGPFIVGVPERVDNCGGGDTEDRPGGCIELEFRDTVDYQIIGMVWKVAVATALPKTSWAQVTTDSGRNCQLAGNQT